MHVRVRPAAAFVPPDVEDPPSPVEMDEEEMEWHRWLGDLMNPTGTDKHDRSGGRGGSANLHAYAVENHRIHVGN